MTTRYYDNAGGSNTSGYDTWAKAATSFATFAGIFSAGEAGFLNAASTGESVASLSPTFAGTPASPNIIMGGTKATSPDKISALTTGAKVTISGTTLGVLGSFHMWGMNFTMTSNSSFGAAFAANGATVQYYEQCSIIMQGTGGSTTISIGSGNGGNSTYVQFDNCTFSMNSGGQRIYLQGRVFIRGGSYAAQANQPTAIFNYDGTRAAHVTIDGFDFSAMASSASLFQNFGANGYCLIRNPKLPSSWTGSILSGTIGAGSRIVMINGDNGNTNYRLNVIDYAGTIRDETSIVRTGGSSDGTTPHSYRLKVATTTINYPHAMASEDMYIWIDSTGSHTISCEVVYDAGTLFNNDELYLDVEYMGTASQPKLNFEYSTRCDPLTKFNAGQAAAGTSSSESWPNATGTGPNGSSTWNKRTITSAAFTTTQKGWIIARLMCNKSAQTIFYDDKLAVT